jgi:hypothetical protein
VYFTPSGEECHGVIAIDVHVPLGAMFGASV